MTSRAAISSVLVGLVLAACAGGPAASGGGGGNETIPPALQMWATFPVSASPRPIVLIGSPVNGPRAFANDDEKLAFIGGAIDRPARLPAEPTSADGYPIVSAERAFAMLRSQGSKVSGATSRTRLTITDTRLGTSTFETDRQNQPMPAWLFTLTGADGPVAVLAVGPEEQWFPSGLAAGRGGEQYWAGAIVSNDHRTLTVSLIGAGSDGPCGVRYEVKLTESPTAVLVSLISHPNQSAQSSAANQPPVACDLVGHLRNASAVLKSPLGARVLVDDLGYPMGATGNP
jgi:hypothetical protein